MAVFNIDEAQARFSELIGRVEQGEEIIVARHGKPVVRVVPIEAKADGKRPIGLDIGKVWMSDDFNDPLPDDFIKAFE